MKKYLIPIIAFLTIEGCKNETVKKEYYSNGKIKSEESFKDGKANGYHVDYYENGNIEDSGSIKDGQLDGLCKGYFINGKLNCIGIYKGGKIDGYYKKYYENGNLRTEGFFKNGQPDSVGKEYTENGQLQIKTIWNQGVIAKAEYYYPDGKVRKIVVYKEGVEKGQDNYDEDGIHLLPSFAIIQAKNGKDTISLGETYIASINVMEHDINSLTDRHIFIGKLNDDDSLIGEAKELPLEKNQFATYTDIPQQPGKHEFSGFLEYTKANGRVVKAPFRWSYYVKPRTTI